MADQTENPKKQEAQTRYVDPTTGAPHPSSASSYTSSGSKDHQSEQPAISSGQPDQSGREASQGTLGGRNPGQPQTAGGDQDSSQSRPDIDLFDPMTSRAPQDLDKVKKIQQHDTQAQRDP